MGGKTGVFFLFLLLLFPGTLLAGSISFAPSSRGFVLAMNDTIISPPEVLIREVPTDTAPLKEVPQERNKLELKKNLRLIGLEEIEGKKRWERRKAARVAVFSNMILPGLGELYNGRRFKTVIMVSLSTIYIGKAWIEHKRAVVRRVSRDRYEPNTRRWNFHNEWYVFHQESSKDFLWWSSAIWIIGMLDAYIDAHLFDLRGYQPGSGGGETKYLTISMSF